MTGGNPQNRTLKMTVVGDGTVGKTCLLITYNKKTFPINFYVPTVFDNYSCTIDFDGSSYDLSLWDTAGTEDYDRIRPLSYPSTDVLLLVYSVDNRNSFNNVRLKWIPEIKLHCPKVPVVLVGAKVDIRKDGSNNENCVRYTEGLEMSKEIGSFTFVECSALTAENVELVFQEALRAALDKPKSEKSKCCCTILSRCTIQ